MFNRKSLYLFLLSLTVCSILFTGLFPYVFGLSLLIVVFMNRGIAYTLIANKALTEKKIDKGYKYLTKAYKTNGVPHIVVNGYIYISMKLGFFDVAEEAIDRVLSGKIHYKLKDGQKNMILTQKGILEWCKGDIKKGLEILESLYVNSYRTSVFYGNYGCLLYLDGQYKKAEEISLEGYDFGSTDKVTLDNLVAVYIALNELDSAEKYLNEILDLAPTFAEAWFHAATFEFIHGNIQKAEEHLDKARKYELSKISSISVEDLDNLEYKIKAAK
ncbi:MAG: tetratricopeptide repeat protein [Spirochaetales bacterium]|nr:tetratricopeptide repeat protein [Spirochaetales bacterium]